MAFDPVTGAARIESDLRAVGTPERAEGERAYLKSDLEFVGATVPAIRKVVKAFVREHPDLGHGDVVELAEALWAAPIHERRMAAVELLYLDRERSAATDLALVERFIRESKTWALVDGLAASVAGHLVEHHPELYAELDRWAGDDDFWVRRSALLALLGPLRRGEGDFDRFGRYADAMLEEKEFFIRKAIGWVLRETAKKRPGLVAGWVAPRTHRASGVTIREAVKPLAEGDRDRLMQAYKERRPASG